MAFLSGAAGEPSNSKLRVATQSTQGVPPAEAGYVDFRVDNNPFSVTPNRVPRAAIQSGGVRAKPLIGKLPLGGEAIDYGDFDPANRGQLRMLANVFRKYTLTDNTTWYRYQFSRNASTAAAEFLAYLSDNDVNPRMRAFDVKHGGFSLSGSPNGNLRLTSPWAGVYFDHFGAPTQTAGTGSTVPKIRGFWEHNYTADATDKDIHVRFDTDASPYTISVKVGSAAVYSNTQTLTEGTWLDLEDESGTILGVPGERVQLYIESGATITALDEFEFEKNRDSWSQSLTAAHPLAVVQGVAQIDDVDVTIEGSFDLTAAYETFELRPDIFRRQGGRVRRTGDLMVTLNLSRDLVDLALQKPLVVGSTIKMALDFQTSETITTGQRYRLIALMPELTVEGTTYAVSQGGTNIEEQYVLSASSDTGTTMTYDGITCTSHLGLYVDTNQSAL